MSHRTNIKKYVKIVWQKKEKHTHSLWLYKRIVKKKARLPTSTALLPRESIVGKIGLIALKDGDFRKISLKSFGPVKYHPKMNPSTENSIPSCAEQTL